MIYPEPEDRVLRGQEDRDFHKLLIGSFVFYFFLGFLAYSAPQQEMTVPLFKNDPPRTARFIINPPKPQPVSPPVSKPKATVPKKKKVPPPPPKKETKIVEQPQEKKIIVPPSPPPVPPKVIRERNRESAKKTGLLKLLARRNTEKKQIGEEPFSGVENLTSASPPMPLEDRFLSLKQEEEVENGLVLSDAEPQVDEYQLMGRTATVVENPFKIKRDSSSLRYRSYDSILRVAQAHQSGLQYLYNKMLQRKPDLMGQIVFEFTINANGTVSDIIIVSSTLHDAEFEKNLTLNIKAWRFEPIPEGRVTIVYPLGFSSV